jgi:hypothetical protein
VKHIISSAVIPSCADPGYLLWQEHVGAGGTYEVWPSDRDDPDGIGTFRWDDGNGPLSGRETAVPFTEKTALENRRMWEKRRWVARKGLRTHCNTVEQGDILTLSITVGGPNPGSCFNLYSGRSYVGKISFRRAAELLEMYDESSTYMDLEEGGPLPCAYRVERCPEVKEMDWRDLTGEVYEDPGYVTVPAVEGGLSGGSFSLSVHAKHSTGEKTRICTREIRPGYICTVRIVETGPGEYPGEEEQG